ncbi:MAG: EpsG family protein [Mameliella sp.]|nr:EpsG family protein [Phaeodactylibacter sp.]
MRASLTKKLFGSFLLMLLSPVSTLISTLSKRQSKHYLKWIIIFFSTFYASTFNIEGIGDGTVHWLNVYDYYVDLSFYQFTSGLKDILLFQPNGYTNDDVYIHILSYFVGNVLGAPDLFFAFVGFIYGYFFASSIVKLFDMFPSPRKNFTLFILAVYFITILNLQSMNTVRTWTGFWILFYATLQYHDTRKLKYILLLFFPPLVHIGYFIMAIPVWVAIFLPLRKTWMIVIYTFSFVGTLFSPQAIVQNLEKSNNVGKSKVKSYYIEEKRDIEDVLDAMGGDTWYLRYKLIGIADWAVVILTTIFIINGDYFFKMNDRESLLFSGGLLVKATSNSTWFLYALTNRTATISVLFILGGILLYWQRNHLLGRSIRIKTFMKPFYSLSILLIIPEFFYYASLFLHYTSFFIAVFPFIAWIGGDSINITLRELIGNLLGVG